MTNRQCPEGCILGERNLCLIFLFLVDSLSLKCFTSNFQCNAGEVYQYPFCCDSFVLFKPTFLSMLVMDSGAKLPSCEKLQKRKKIILFKNMIYVFIYVRWFVYTVLTLDCGSCPPSLEKCLTWLGLQPY